MKGEETMEYKATFIEVLSNIIAKGSPKEMDAENDSFPKLVVVTSAGIFRGEVCLHEDENDLMSKITDSYNEKMSSSDRLNDKTFEAPFCLKNVVELNSGGKFSSLIFFPDQISAVTISGQVDF